MNGRREAEATAEARHAGARADRFIAEEMHLFTRSQLRQHDALITVNGDAVKPSRALREGDVVCVSYIERVEPSVTAEEMQLDILYEDADVVVVNKPQGMVVHPAAGNWTGTLAQGLMHHVENLADQNESLRPGIVHRLDKDTSGVLITAKSVRAQEFLAAQFRRRSTEKLYLAIVRGAPPRSSDRVETGITRDPRNRKRFTAVTQGGKHAETSYRVLKRYPGYTFLVFAPSTGRTHQIRVHARHIGCPIVGDPIYSRKDKLFPDSGLMLHAYRLTLRLPGDRRTETFTAPLPDRFRHALRVLADLPSAASGAQPLPL